MIYMTIDHNDAQLSRRLLIMVNLNGRRHLYCPEIVEISNR